MSISFPDTVEFELHNWLTGIPYTLVRGDSIEPLPAHVSEITSICNEPAVYTRLFRERLEGRAYPEQSAVDWLAHASRGWREGSHFVFVVATKGGEVAAACEIMSSDTNWVEIGYWSSQTHRGVMTNALKEVCGLARRAAFRVLYARINNDNTRSAAVVEPAGFKLDSVKSAEDDTNNWYTLCLVDPDPHHR